MKWDVYATIAIQIEGDTFDEALAEARKMPLEYWDADSMDITEVVGHAD